MRAEMESDFQASRERGAHPDTPPERRIYPAARRAAPGLPDESDVPIALALKSEARCPLPEGRKKAEFRNPKTEARCRGRFGFRPSFGLRPSAFDLRPSDLARVATSSTFLTELFARSLSAFRLSKLQPSPPKVERETALRPADIEIRAWSSPRAQPCWKGQRVTK